MPPVLPRRPRAAIAVVVIALSAAAGLAQGQALTPVEVDTEASKIYNSVMSPYCPGVLLAGCGSGAAAALRDSVKAHLRRGRTREQIMDDLLAVYGADILGMPSYTGTGGLVWLLPGLAFAFGLGGAYWWVRQGRQTAPPAVAVSPAAAGTEALRHKLEKDLQERS